MHKVGKTWSVNLFRLCVAAFIWSALYGAYRLYYALGGTSFIPGELSSATTFRFINLVAAIVMLLLALLPLVMYWVRNSAKWKLLVLVACWLVAVACCSHALIDIAQRILSLTGHLQIQYPSSIWTSVNYREADLQDLFGNEPWFLIEGLLFAAIGWWNIAKSKHRTWAFTLVGAVGVATIVGLLVAVGVIGRTVIS